MCRMFLYVSRRNYKNPKMRLKYVLDEASHSIKNQAYKDPFIPGLDKKIKGVLSRNPKLNLDGYGILFGLNDSICLIKSENPILENDTTELKNSLMNQIENLKSNFIMVFIRNNNHKKKFPNEVNKVQPFIYKNWYFTHNGGFTQHFDYMKSQLIKEINLKYLNEIGSNLDSKILFSYILTKLENNDLSFESIKKMVINIINYFYSIKPNKFEVTLNFILSNLKKNLHIILRYRTCKQIPAALYYKMNFKKGFIISSEPINFQKGWKLLNDQLLIIKDFEFKVYDLRDQVNEICR